MHPDPVLRLDGKAAMRAFAAGGSVNGQGGMATLDHDVFYFESCLEPTGGGGMPGRSEAVMVCRNVTVIDRNEMTNCRIHD